MSFKRAESYIRIKQNISSSNIEVKSDRDIIFKVKVRSKIGYVARAID